MTVLKSWSNKMIITGLFLFLICTMCQALYNFIFTLKTILKAWYYHPVLLELWLRNFQWFAQVCSANKVLALGFQPHSVVEHRLLNTLHCHRRCGRSGGKTTQWALYTVCCICPILILRWLWRHERMPVLPGEH